MAATTLEDLTTQISQVREKPGLPYEVGKELSLDDIRQTMATTRAALVAAIEAAPDSAFEPQPDNDEGEEVWSVGPIIAHCNSSMMGIGGGAAKAAGLDLGDPPEALAAASESRVMGREEALAAARVVNPDDFFAMIPDDDKLDAESPHDFFGPMSGRTWLYFMAMHEAEHVAQVKALS